jgi:uncharacterized membrane protein
MISQEKKRRDQRSVNKKNVESRKSAKTQLSAVTSPAKKQLFVILLHVSVILLLLYVILLLLAVILAQLAVISQCLHPLVRLVTVSAFLFQ